jgi:hypothetical protein
MKHAQNFKFVSITPPAAIVDNAAFTTASIDTRGYKYMVVIAFFGAMDIAMAALKLQQSDTDGSYADVTGGDFSVSGTLPSATADNTAVAWFVDLKGKKRYFDVSATGGDGTAGTYLTVVALLFDAEETPNTVAERGLAQQLFC